MANEKGEDISQGMAKPENYNAGLTLEKLYEDSIANKNGDCSAFYAQVKQIGATQPVAFFDLLALNRQARTANPSLPEVRFNRTDGELRIEFPACKK